MLKKKLSEFKYNVFTEFNDSWPILTAGSRRTGFNSMTVSWGGLGVLWGKNVAFVFVRKSRYTYEFIEQSDSVTLSFLSDKYKEAKALFGKASGRTTDKYAVSGLHPALDIDFNGYYVAEADYVLKMKKLYSLDVPYERLPEDIQSRYYPKGDMHTMYVCEITQFLKNEE